MNEGKLGKWCGHQVCKSTLVSSLLGNATLHPIWGNGNLERVGVTQFLYRNLTQRFGWPPSLWLDTEAQSNDSETSK